MGHSSLISIDVQVAGAEPFDNFRQLSDDSLRATHYDVVDLSMEKTLSSQATNWKEGRRLRAWELYQEGWKQSDIANALG